MPGCKQLGKTSIKTFKAMLFFLIERDQVMWAISKPREGGTGANPERAFHGPLVVLIDGDTYSNGEFFAEAINRMGLATTIGVRTWGGSTGIEPHQDMVDGGGTTPPQFGIYGLDGSWPIEGWGVEPQIVFPSHSFGVAALVPGQNAYIDPL